MNCPTPEQKGCSGWPFLTLVLLGLFCGAFAGVSFAEAPEVYRRTTPHYVITTDVGQDLVDLLPLYVESLYAEFEEFFRGHRLKKVERASVKIYGERERYDRSVPEPLRGTAGCFLSRDNALMTYLGDRSREDLLSTLAHEASHQFFFNRIGGGIPMWLDEGFAEYYAEADWTGEYFVTGQVPADRLHIVQSAILSDTYIPLRVLFRIRPTRWTANVESDYHLTNLQYSQAWSVVHFLLHAGEGRFADRFHGYLRSLAGGEPRDRALEKHFGSNLGSMENSWKSYMLSLRPDPVSRCRSNLTLLLSIASTLYETPQDVESMDALVDLLLAPGGPEWIVHVPYGDYLESGHKDRIGELLRCSCSTCDKTAGYIMRHDQETGGVELYCTAHEGLIVRASSVLRQGRWSSESEVLAERMAPSDIREKIERKRDAPVD